MDDASSAVIQPVADLPFEDMGSTASTPTRPPYSEVDSDADTSSEDGDFEEGDIEMGIPLGSAWTEWPSLLAPIAGVVHPPQPSATPLRVATFCSGTDSPIAALEQVIGAENIRHVTSLDSMKASQEFIKANFSPEHLYSDIDCLSKKRAECMICGQKCSGFNKPVDLLIMGFPCKAFSVMNPARWMPAHDPMQAQSSKPFLRFREWLENCSDPPKVIILENVAGCLKASKTRQAPVEFILRGEMVNHKGKVQKYGIEHDDRYMTVQTPLQTCDRYGLPLRRRRVFWVMLRKDQFSPQELVTMTKKLQDLNNYSVQTADLKTFVEEDSDDSADTLLFPPPASARRRRASRRGGS